MMEKPLLTTSFFESQFKHVYNLGRQDALSLTKKRLLQTALDMFEDTNGEERAKTAAAAVACGMGFMRLRWDAVSQSVVVEYISDGEMQ